MDGQETAQFTSEPRRTYGMLGDFSSTGTAGGNAGSAAAAHEIGKSSKSAILIK